VPLATQTQNKPDKDITVLSEAQNSEASAVNHWHNVINWDKDITVLSEGQNSQTSAANHLLNWTMFTLKQGL